MNEMDQSPSKGKLTFELDTRTLPDGNSAAQMHEGSEHAEDQAKAQHPAAADPVARPINVELKTNRASESNDDGG